MDLWYFLMELVVLLGGALLLGALAQRLRQSPIVGYLLAGTLIGPLLFNAQAVSQSAELGVALLLFSIGLEFSVQRLRQMGRMAFGAGTFQVVATMILATLAMVWFRGWAAALSIGAVTALSSTAVVMRVLVDRAEIDSVRGRTCLAILLLQDIAIVPLVLMVSFFGAGGTDLDIWRHIIKIIVAALGLGVGGYLLIYQAIPRLLSIQGFFANRELTVLLAFAVGLGAAWSAHALGISPALGAFMAGILLGESPFATQVRSDIGSLRIIMVTLFFASVGMLANPMWFVTHLHWVAAAAMVIFIAKTGIIYGVLRLFRLDGRHALAAGITLAQIGEFSFVLVTAGRQGGVFSGFVFDLAVSTIIVLMFAAPYMVSHAFVMGDAVMGLLTRSRAGREPLSAEAENPEQTPVVVIGLGPAGLQVVQQLKEHRIASVVIDINPRSRAVGREMGVRVHLGDAASEEVLAHAGVMQACLAVVTLPDPGVAVGVVKMLKKLRPTMPVAARCRYNRHVADMRMAGAHIVIDEETGVGRELGEIIITHLQVTDDVSLACGLAGQPAPSTAHLA